jgi:hypothetical protein
MAGGIKELPCLLRDPEGKVIVKVVRYGNAYRYSWKCDLWECPLRRGWAQPVGVEMGNLKGVNGVVIHGIIKCNGTKDKLD